MLYHAYELTHATLAPLKALSELGQKINSSIYNPVAYTPIGRSMAASFEVFNRMTRRYGKPTWDIETTTVNGKSVDVEIDIQLCTRFCDLIHFRRDLPESKNRKDPKVLIVAPLSGHYATLLRGTVEAMLPEHDVYVTDWRDARMVPLSLGPFDLDDHIDLMIDFMRYLGPDVNVIAVCQPAVSVLAAVALMAAEKDPMQPHSIVLMGGPIDTRENPTKVNKHAETKDLSWFENSVISRVPFPLAGAMRKVYPGFVQLTGFMTMNLDRHMKAHVGLYNHLVEGDGDSADQHREFYDEYLSVMDLPGEFFLQTIETVFKEHSLPKGTMKHRETIVDPSKIRKTALMTVEGEKDDICGIGQTSAAHKLCSNLSDDKKLRHIQMGAGHYGVFNGRRWKTEIQPLIAGFIRKK
ncbi:MAG: polyhydroxyalkanoate depolymerase [Rhodospirillaceae bacterium]|jgi:poly(3-hydroxybutyrate) depolymerase|nr:polyhydroxyalkanoate depolymerase [Rhodospirillaceae bacterium]MBT5245470.1 polyhydroxyalkanoate depolymerase [Rhodospirillaceae bacterium]MBT5562626.1 polyhydroxyalkanoate depolymerase [Rhodospirillaceae bacterium]MBT6242516.1 polyhydroxyalkanoate depolymerase [Rhodospirillaceae bacterium]MBT7136568.1 polyhydroxyalkanoate depolymerase [Rhodospirillaceae bacterium]